VQKSSFEIFEIKGHSGGVIALSPQPMTQEEFDTIAEWKPDIVVTHTTETEFPNDPFLPTEFRNSNFDWHYVPIIDFGAPIGDDLEIWEQTANLLTAELNTGARILCHCKGGQGRSGMMVLRVLVSQGEAAQVALARLREIRPGAVETDAQMSWALKEL
jgi:protein-tyrosine phosphatase